MAASPYPTLAAEGFELAPAWLILQLVQEPQTGSSSGSTACILRTCPGTLTLPRIHRWGGKEMHQQKGKYSGLALPCGSGMAQNNLRCSPVAGWCPPACATRCLVPPPALELRPSAARGHCNPLPSKPVGSQKIWFPGESQSASMARSPPQASPATISLAVLK